MNAASPLIIFGYADLTELAAELFRSAPAAITWAWVESHLDEALDADQRVALGAAMNALTDRLDAGGCLDHAHHYDCDDCVWPQVPALVEPAVGADASTLEAA